MGTNYQRRDAEISGDSHRNEFSADAKSRLLLKQKSIVWIRNHSKYNVERQIRITSQVFAFF